MSSKASAREEGISEHLGVHRRFRAGMARMKTRAFGASECPGRTGGVEPEDREDRVGRRRGICEIRVIRGETAVLSSEACAREEGRYGGSVHESQTARITVKPVRPREIFAGKRDSGLQ
jgi:hypothetical protein